MFLIYKGIKFTALGCGIYKTEIIIDEREVNLEGVTLRRFMDCLWLPAPTNQLSQEQINVISRFREDQYHRDPQFDFHRAYVNRVAHFITSAGYSSILEIGCGLFPLRDKLSPTIKYQCIESDLTCIPKNVAAGSLTVTVNEAETRIGLDEFECFLALFVFQFPIEDKILEVVGALVPKGDGFFNVPSASQDVRMQRIDQVARLGFVCAPLPNTPGGSSNELIYAARYARPELIELWKRSQ